MTWQPSDREVAAYIEGAGVAAMSDGLPAVNRAQYVARAGLQAAYAKLEERLFGGSPTVLGPAATLERISPPIMQYHAVYSLTDIERRSAEGWRLHTARPHDTEGWVYFLERERPSTSDGGG